MQREKADCDVIFAEGEEGWPVEEMFPVLMVTEKKESE